jgi:hypothetical protein
VKLIARVTERLEWRAAEQQQTADVDRQLPEHPAMYPVVELEEPAHEVFARLRV